MEWGIGNDADCGNQLPEVRKPISLLRIESPLLNAQRPGTRGRDIDENNENFSIPYHCFLISVL
jgi:hypothetical protein